MLFGSKLRYVVLALTLVALVLAGCGGDKKDEGQGNAPALSETFESASGVKVSYPQGWVAGEQGGQVVVANSQATLDKALAEDSAANPNKDEAALMIMVMPAAAMGEGVALKDAFDMMMAGVTGEGATALGEPQSFKVGDQEAIRQNVRSEGEGEGMVAARVDGDMLIIGILATGEGGLGTFETTAVKMFESISYTEPAG
jgi:hypothetical protein